MELSDFKNMAVGGTELNSIYYGATKIWEKNTDAAANVKFVATTAPQWELYSDAERVQYSYEGTTSQVNFPTVKDLDYTYDIQVTGDTLTEITSINGIHKFDFIRITAANLIKLNLDGITFTAPDGRINGSASLLITVNNMDTASKGYLTTILGNSGYTYTWDGDTILNCTK